MRKPANCGASGVRVCTSIKLPADSGSPLRVRA
jgi:hypothetical protein